MIVWSVVNIEEWEITRPMARQLSIAPQGQSAIPDMPNWTWYEYGMRVGFWRLMRALKKAKVTPTMSLNAKVCETYPEATAAARDAGWEFMAHSYVQMPIQQIADKQPEIMQQSIDILQKFTGKFPNGWLGPGRGQMFDTLDHVAKAGFTWFGDWVLDDQPIWVKTAHGPVLAIPYSAEINDITMMVSHHHEFDVLLDRTRDAFDRLYLESKELTRILAIGVHPYVTGQAHRIKYFEQLYALHQQASGRGALDRPADPRLVREAGAEAAMHPLSSLANGPAWPARCKPGGRSSSAVKQGNTGCPPSRGMTAGGDGHEMNWRDSLALTALLPAPHAPNPTIPTTPSASSSTRRRARRTTPPPAFWVTG